MITIEYECKFQLNYYEVYVSEFLYLFTRCTLPLMSLLINMKVEEILYGYWFNHACLHRSFVLSFRGLYARQFVGTAGCISRYLCEQTKIRFTLSNCWVF